jgi:hypothetical protein
MQFTPKTRKQILEESLLPDGLYALVITDSADKIASNGKSYIYLRMVTKHPSGRDHSVFDTLYGDQAKKLLNFAESGKIVDHYESGTIEASICNKKVVWGVIRTKYDKDGVKEPQNFVYDYVTEESYIKNLTNINQNSSTPLSIGKNNAFVVTQEKDY